MDNIPFVVMTDLYGREVPYKVGDTILAYDVLCKKIRKTKVQAIKKGFVVEGFHCYQCEAEFYKRNFKHVLMLKDRAEVALRDIRDGKDNPSYLARKIVGETMWRGL